MKNKKGGGQKAVVRFKDAIEQNIFELGSEHLYYKRYPVDKKKYITLHEQGILEYNNKFFTQEGGYNISIVNNFSQLSNNMNQNDNYAIFFTIDQLKKELGFTGKKRSMYKYIYYKDKPLNTYKNSIIPSNKEPPGKPWRSNNNLLNLTELENDGLAYVMGINNKSKLRFKIEEKKDNIKNVLIKTDTNWEFFKLKILLDEIINGTINNKFKRKRRGELSIRIKKNKQKKEKKS